MFIGNTAYLASGATPYLLGILQSRSFWYSVSQICQPLRLRAGLWQYRLFPQFLDRISIPDASDTDRQIIGDIALNITALAKECYVLHQKGRARILSDFGTSGKSLNNKLSAWWDLDVATFRSELLKVFKAAIPVAERDDRDDWLAAGKAKHIQLTGRIVELESELNDRVYTLFDLTPDERKVIEDSTKYRYGEV